MQIKIHDTFKPFVKNSKHFEKMLIFIDKEKDIAPLKENVFRFLSINLDNLKCIILGMDPYPSTYIKNGIKTPVATGRAFEVANVDKWTDKYRQTSLAVIFKTLYYYKTSIMLDMDKLREIPENSYKYLNIHNWFDEMENNGVMFLNASLTTSIGRAGAHIDIWKPFMNELIEYLAKNRKNIKWLIWGRNAFDRVTKLVDSDNIIYTCHPATRVNNTFIEDCCFKKIRNIEWF